MPRTIIPEKVIQDNDKTKGKWFCKKCNRPINEGYSHEGLCVVCAEPFLNPEYED